MNSGSKNKTFHYKRVVLTKESHTLQALLELAFSNGIATKAKARQEIINQDDQSFRLINHHKIQHGMFFGQMIFYEAGRSQALISLDDEAEYYTIDAITPDKIDTSSSKGPSEVENERARKRREFIDSMLYFGVMDNHIVIMQSLSLKARELETHLSWLLGTCTNLIDRNSALILQDKPTEETIRRIEQSPVKKVVLGSPVESREEQDNHDQTTNEAKGVKAVKFIPCGIGVDVIRAALGEDWFNRLDLHDALDDANLHVNLEITYLRKTTETGQRMLDNIATSLRHANEDDVTIDLKDGGKIQGSDLKLQGKISVKILNNGLIDETDLYHQMHTWLASKISNDEVEA